MSAYHFGVYIGRFQPLHIGHEHIIRNALDQVETLIVAIGSSAQAPTPNNPFSFAERKLMLMTAFRHEMSIGRLVAIPIYDCEEDADWVAMIKRGVENAIRSSPGGHDPHKATIALAGYGKDASSYYLKMFPEWGSIQIDTQHGTISATDIRNDFFRRLPRYPDRAVNNEILDFLESYALTDNFKNMVAEREYYSKYPEQYGKGPHLTTDALVTWRGKVLLVTRGKVPGKGLFAMPGGFVNDHERFIQACLRELGEETQLVGAELSDFLVNMKLADDPKRSLRGRVVSQVFHFDIPDDYQMPDVIGSDDAAHAAWYDFEELARDQFFEDHHTLISQMLS